jgi:hypothetical protein
LGLLLVPPKDKKPDEEKPAEKKPNPTKHKEGLIDVLIQRFMVGHVNFIIPYSALRNASAHKFKHTVLAER